MNLYRIIVLHGGPKSSHTSTETYVASESEEKVAKWIDTTHNYDGWFGEDSDEERKSEVMENKGDLASEEGWEDAYYGVTKWGWEAISATDMEIDSLVRIGIAKTIE